MMDDDKEKVSLKQSAVNTNHVIVELQKENTAKTEGLNLDDTNFTDSTRKSRQLCGSARKNEMNNSKKNNKESIQMNTLNTNEEANNKNNQVRIVLSSTNEDNPANNNKNNNNQEISKDLRSSHRKIINCKCSKKSSSKDDLSIEEKESSLKIIGKTIKRLIPCLVAWTLLVASSGVYFAFVASELHNILNNFFYWIILMFLHCVLFLYVIVNFLIAILRDPGRFEKIIISADDPNFNDDTKSPLYKTIKIQKAAVKIKWCSVSLSI
jgi:hypothetical protein